MKITSYLSALLLVMVGMLAMGCASTPTQESTGEYVSDTWITTKVKSVLVGDSVVNSTEVNVETFKGAVQLSGFVGSQDAMNQALILAGEVKGVTSVENGMTIK